MILYLDIRYYMIFFFTLIKLKNHKNFPILNFFENYQFASLDANVSKKYISYKKL